MESDRSLLEITNEDDSLFQETSSADLNNYLPCSPLLIPRSEPSARLNRSSVSRSKGTLDDKHAEGCSQQKGIDNKENFCVNKEDSPSLTTEPQSMKRRRKGKGYNLRKSLAWDRAFFTEDGILDPLELCMISGTLSNKSGGKSLLTIHEEGCATVSGVSDTSSNVVHLPELKGNLLRELPATTQVDQRKRGGVSHGHLRKNNSSARDNATSKLPAAPAHCTNRSGSKRRGCPRPPLAPSSPANANAVKVATNNSHIFKTSTLPSPSTLAPTTTVGGSCTKHNQIAQPAVNIQKHVTQRGCINNPKTVKKKAGAGTGCKSVPANSSPSHTEEVMENIPSEMVSSFKAKPVLVMEPNRTIGLSSCPVLRTGKHFQNPQCTGEHRQPAKLKMAKPSGLRMPSPSLGFFGQRSAQSRNSSEVSIPNLRRAGNLTCINEPGLPHAQVEMSKDFKGVRETGRGKVLNRETCASSTANQPENLRPDMNKAQQVPSSLRSCKPISKYQKSAGIYDDDEKCFPGHAVSDDKLLLKDKLCELDASPKCLRQVVEDPSPDIDGTIQFNGISRSTDILDQPDLVDKQHLSLVKNCTSTSGTHSGDAIIYAAEDTPVLCRRPIGLAHDVHKLSAEETKLKQWTCESNRVSKDKNNSLQLTVSLACGENKYFEDLQKDDSGVITGLSPKVQGLNEWELENDESLHQLKYMKQASEGAQMQCQSGTVSVKGCNGNLGTIEGRCFEEPHQCDGWKFLNADFKVNVSSKEVIKNITSSSQEHVCLDLTEDGFARTNQPLQAVDAEVDTSNDVQSVESCNSGVASVEHGQSLVNNDNMTLDSSSFEDSQLCKETNITPADRNVFNSFFYSFQLELPEKAKEDEIATLVETLLPADEQVLSINGSRVVESCKNNIMPNVCGEDVTPANDETEHFTRHTELNRDNVLCDEAEACSSDFSRIARCISDELREENVLQNVICSASKHKDIHEGETFYAGQAAPAMQNMGEHLIAKNPSSDSIGSEQSSDHSVQVTSSAAGSSIKVFLDQFLGKGFSSSVQSDQRIQDGSNKHAEGACGVGKKHKQEMKQENFSKGPPPNAVPFSDEWLAAKEAAGEEILSMKTGAVQNSPPDKPVAEPGPWSPVRRKINQEVGPHDCTKFTIVPPSN